MRWIYSHQFICRLKFHKFQNVRFIYHVAIWILYICIELLTTSFEKWRSSKALTKKSNIIKLVQYIMYLNLLSLSSWTLHLRNFPSNEKEWLRILFVEESFVLMNINEENFSLIRIFDFHVCIVPFIYLFKWKGSY